MPCLRDRPLDASPPGYWILLLKIREGGLTALRTSSSQCATPRPATLLPLLMNITSKRTQKVRMQSAISRDKEFVLVEHDFEYTAKDGSVITIKPNERYILLKRTNEHWWHVCQDNKTKPFYIPAKYVKVLSTHSLGSNGCPPYKALSEDVIENVPQTQYSYTFLPSNQQISTNISPSSTGHIIQTIHTLPAVSSQETGISNSQTGVINQRTGTTQALSGPCNLPTISTQRIGSSNTLPAATYQNVSISNALSTSSMQNITFINKLPAGTMQSVIPCNTLSAGSMQKVSPSNTLSAGSMQRVSPSNTPSAGTMQRVSPSNTPSAGTMQRVSPSNMPSAGTMQTVSPNNTLSAGTMQRVSPSNTLSAGTMQRVSPSNTMSVTSTERNNLSTASVQGISTSNPLLSGKDQLFARGSTMPAKVQQRHTPLSGASLSFLDISVMGENSPKDTLQIYVQEQPTTRMHAPMRTFNNSKKILDSKKRISFALPPDLQPPIRPTQSLNDLQNIITETLVDHPPQCPERNGLYQTKKVNIEQSNTVGCEPSSSPIQVVSEETEERVHIYENLEGLRKDPARERVPSQQRSSTSTLDDWETHTDKGSGLLFYYNCVTGETTWDSPFDQQEDQINSPISPTSLSPLHEDSDWEKHFDETSKQFYFYNSVTGETSWDPPEEELNLQGMQSVFSYSYGSMDRRPPTPEADYPDYPPDNIEQFPEADYGEGYTGLYESISPDKVNSVDRISGWSYKINPEGKKIYTNNFNNEMWLQSQDQHGKTYFYKPDGSLSQWQLPQVGPPGHQRNHSDSSQDNNIFSSLPLNFTKFTFQKDTEDFVPRPRRSDSDNNLLLHAGNHQTKSLEKAGVLHKTKIAENGKRIRKNWSSSWTVLEGGILTFFKDGKNLSSNSLKQSVLTIPEHTVQLQGATLSWATKEKSSKKHVLELKTYDGSEYLIHHDSETITKDWYISLSNSIGKNIRTSTENTPESDADSPRLFGSNERLGYKDEKDKKTSGQSSNSSNSDSDRNVRAKLKKFLQRRPTLQSLRDKGYIKDQVFGCPLHQLCEREKTNVPEFVSKSIQAVERRGLDIDGLYRVSGNLAVIQKLRYKVDHDESFNLDDGRWEDVHVITGALKLFFRELPEPLFPYSHFDMFVEAIKLGDQTQKIRRMKELVQSLPSPNLETMRVLFKHLCSVIEHRESNRMSVQSVAIVFGPTLLRPEAEGANIAMYMVFQNQIVEHILLQYKHIFNTS
ncbi:rho GTPase-activating protein 27-like [Pelodytes ibericus]